jgi:hypothetical protein
MLKRFLIVVALIVTGLYFFRVRVFLRDPLATVYRDGVKQNGVEVYMNEPKDVLLIRDDDRVMVQHWDRIPAAPLKLTCLRWTMCFTDADNAPKVAGELKQNYTYDPKVIFTDTEVFYLDRSGAQMRVTLR